MSDSKSPRRSGYAAKLKRRERDFEEEDEARQDAEMAALKADQVLPLPEAARLEAQDSHAATVAGWKSRFKVGDVHLVGGVKLKVTHIGKRGITFRHSH